MFFPFFSFFLYTPHLMSTRYRTLLAPSQGLYKEKGSRFISYAFPVCSTEEITVHLSSLRSEHHAARHCCYAYLLGFDAQESRANDDGEPSGTAGRPILNALRGEELSNVLLVVVRYFGGIKLGVSGLIEAYRTASLDALSHAELVWREVRVRYLLRFGYMDSHTVYATLKRLGGEIRSETWEELCTMHADLPKESTPQFLHDLGTLPQCEYMGEV